MLCGTANMLTKSSSPKCSSMQFKSLIEADINKIFTLNEPLHTSEFGSAVTEQHTWGERASE